MKFIPSKGKGPGADFKHLAVSFSAFFMILPVFLHGQETLPRIEITVSPGTRTINDVLESITLQTGYLFTYDATLIDGNREVAFRADHLTLRETLDSLLQHPGLRYRLIDRNIVIYEKNQSPPGPLLGEIERPLLQGKVIDQKSGDPLAYATIALYGTSLGSITNQEGEFSFKIPPHLSDPLLVISYMGFKQKLIPVVYPLREKMTITLERELIPLQEVIIRFSDPVMLLKEAMSRFPENYMNEHATMTAFYRESVRRGTHFLAYSEAVLDVAKAPYDADLQSDAIRIRKGRKITDVTSEDTIMVKLRSGISTSFDLDVVKHRPDFLLPDFTERYDLEFSDLMIYGEQLVYVISFKQKSGIPEPLFQGQLYLDQESLALLAADFEYNPELIHKTPGLFLVSRSPSIRITPMMARYHVEYRKLQGRYHVSQVRGEMELRIRKKRHWIGSKYTISIEMAITDVIPGGRLRIDPQDRVRPNVVLSDEKFEFDPLFWGIYNTIEPESSLMESIEKLEENRQQNNQ
ncbi:MAG: carboxypeptidase-like regulatory domain-containing protein [Bacteroidales bacterium]